MLLKKKTKHTSLDFQINKFSSWLAFTCELQTEQHDVPLQLSMLRMNLHVLQVPSQ